MQTPKFITFTGVDANTDLSACRDLAAQYPVEFAVLYSRTRTEPRYTGVFHLKSLTDMGVACAIHLCGEVARDTMKNRRYALPDPTMEPSRIQVNLREKDYTWEGLEALGKQWATIRQARDVQHWPLTPLDVAPLLDCSGGRGTQIQEWPQYTPAQFVGYAGGFRPGNVKEFLQKLHPHHHGFWIDMETGVRTDDWFDIEKCRQVCEEVYG